MKVAEIRKALTAASGAVATLVSVGLLSGTAERWTTGVLAVLTAAAVYLVPNARRVASGRVVASGGGGGAVAPVKPADAGVTLIEFLIIATFALALILVLYAVGVLR